MKERVPEFVADGGEMAEVLCRDGRCRLDLQAGDAAVVALEDEVDLGTVSVAEVVEANSRVGPGLLLGYLVDDEALEHWSGGGGSRHGESLGACAEEVGGQSAIGQVDLWVLLHLGGEVAGPGRYSVHEVYGFKDGQIAADGVVG